MEMTEEQEIAAQLYQGIAGPPSSSEQEPVEILEQSSRKRPATRDEYEEYEAPKRKALKLSRKAKRPIVQPVTSKGPVKPKSPRPTRKAATQVNESIEPTQLTPAPVSVDSGATPSKRGRGRPSKKTKATTDVVKATEHAESQAARTQKALDTFQPYADVSPTKPTQRHASRKGKGKGKEVIEPEDENSEGEDNHGLEEDVEEVEEVEELNEVGDYSHCLDAAGSLVRLQELKVIRDIAKRVGCTEVKGQWKWKWKNVQGNSKDKRAKFLTKPGKGTDRTVRRLLECYERFSEAENHEEKSACEEASSQIIDSLSDGIDTIVETQLGPSSETKTRMLHDIYFNLVPGLLHAVFISAKVYSKEATMSDERLSEFLDLVRMSYELAHKARSLPKRYQPLSEQYETTGPTKEILPRLLALRNKVHEEWEHRANAKKEAADREKHAAERERLAEERKQRLAEAERRRQEDEQRDLLAREVAKKVLWERQRAQLAAAEAERARKFAPRRQASQRFRIPVQHIEDDESDDPFAEEPAVYSAEDRRRNLTTAQKTMNGNETRRFESQTKTNSTKHVVNAEDDEDGESVDLDDGLNDEEDLDIPEHESVFGTNNVNTPNQTEPFTREEKAVFMDIILDNHGDEYRYEKAAHALGRSLDEIIDLAKNVQESMDQAHANGKFWEEWDEVTWDIWVPPNSEPATCKRKRLSLSAR